MWGGRFAAGPAEIMQRFTPSIDFDRRFYAQDIAGSKAHAAMLARQGIISEADNAAIQDGLDRIKGEIEAGTFAFDRALEDIHTNIEARLKQLIGPAAGRLHTARSRNDQVATDFRLWVRDAIDALDQQLVDYIAALLERAEAEADTVMPGFTHTQSAQPVTFGHHMMAYVEMAARDRARLADCRARVNESPLGAAALAGTSFPIDRAMTAAALGFARPLANSMDAVASRDFVIEFLSCLSILAVHLSRLAEEMVWWSSVQFRFIRMSDGFSTGSSIMPQKRNPDAAELVRGKAGRAIGALMGMLTTMKGLPMTHNTDMQEDKERSFDAFDNMALCLAAMTGMVRDMTVNRAELKAALAGGFPTATDLADWLTRVLNLPFRDAHHITGRVVRLAEEKGCDIADLALAEMQAIEPRITAEVFSVLSVEASVASRNCLGGTAPANVRAEVARWKAALAS
ncbi:MAG: argininosuccinate lyase [Thalassobaculales bacterium]